jgi:hypothetical protein
MHRLLMQLFVLLLLPPLLVLKGLRHAGLLVWVVCLCVVTLLQL